MLPWLHLSAGSLPRLLSRRKQSHGLLNGWKRAAVSVPIKWKVQQLCLLDPITISAAFIAVVTSPGIAFSSLTPPPDGFGNTKRDWRLRARQWREGRWREGELRSAGTAVPHLCRTHSKAGNLFSAPPCCPAVQAIPCSSGRALVGVTAS